MFDLKTVVVSPKKSPNDTRVFVKTDDGSERNTSLEHIQKRIRLLEPTYNEYLDLKALEDRVLEIQNQKKSPKPKKTSRKKKA